MDDVTLRWIIGGQIAVNVAFAKLWWDHAKECRERRAEQASMQTTLETISHEIGDHETGIRGSLHQLRNQISPMYIDWQRSKR